jgi:HPt (histidine-containing phosphotransfer) domain-containing protein
MNETPVINWAQLLDLREFQRPGEPDVVADLIQTFIEQAAMQLTRMRAAEQAGNAREIELEAHAIKGSAAAIGAIALAEAAQVLETHSANGRLSRPLIDRVMESLRQAQAVLLRGPS